MSDVIEKKINEVDLLSAVVSSTNIICENNGGWNRLNMDTLINRIKDIISSAIHESKSHVGQIVMSSTLSTMEQVIAEYGGTTWEKIEGKFLLGTSSTHAIGSTGGSETVTLTVNQMPAHTHIMGQNGDFSYGTGWGNGSALSAYSAGTATWTPESSSTGGNQAHDNMPPFEAVYIWKRTA